MPIKLSLVIPTKDKNDPKLADLLRSIDAQDFPKEELEVLVITEGTSESAKAIGIRRAKGEVIGILASDNELVVDSFLREHNQWARLQGCSQPGYYHYTLNDDILNRYFSLIGANDPLAIYMCKADRKPYGEGIGLFDIRGKTVGDNGFFIQKRFIEMTDLDNYYHIDNGNEALTSGFRPAVTSYAIWHKTGGNIFKFLAKRYRYGLQHAFNSNRRWHLVDFSQPKDIMRFLWFIIASATFIHPLILSMRGYLKIRDIAWFVHPIMCFLTLATYAILICHLGLRHLYQSLFAPWGETQA